MNRSSSVTAGFCSAACRLTIGALLAGAAIAAAAEVATDDGLVPVKVRNLDKAWQRPDSSLAKYTSVLIRPVKVSFSKTWRPQDFGPHGLKDKEVERIRSTYAEIAAESFSQVLSTGGYGVAASPGANVLEVEAEIVDLYVNGPEYEADVFVRTYVRSFGDLRLLITLRDSASGAVLFRSSDFKRGDETGRLEWANSVYNRAEAEQALRGWARQLQRLLEKQDS